MSVKLEKETSSTLDDETHLKKEDQADDDSLDENSNDNKENEQKSGKPESSRPSKKRRRMNTEEHEKTKAEETKGASTRKKSQSPAKKSSPKKKGSRAGRPKGTYTPEEDAYLLHLRGSTSNAHEVWVKFQEKFHNSKTERALVHRYFNIKDAVLLSGEEEASLNETIEEITRDIAALIVEKFAKKNDGKKVSKAFVRKKMKEGGFGGGRKVKNDVEDIEDEDEQ